VIYVAEGRHSCTGLDRRILVGRCPTPEGAQRRLSRFLPPKAVISGVQQNAKFGTAGEAWNDAAWDEADVKESYRKWQLQAQAAMLRSHRRPSLQPSLSIDRE
jgi:hypothetical protein